MPSLTATVSLLLLIGFCSGSLAQQPDWSQIRSDHPRLYFNADTWPAVKVRAEGPLAAHFAEVRKFADNPKPKAEWSAIQRPPKREESTVDAYDWGDRLMCAALVYRLQPDPQRLEGIRDMLFAALDYYHACFAQGKSVNWYAFSRLGWLCALDWAWNDLQPAERLELARGFLKHVDAALHEPSKQRQNRGGEVTGYYGDDNLALFTGLALYGEGADDAMALRCLNEGYAMYQKMISHRRVMAGDDGGAASPTLGYSMGEYPLAEWNYLHCLKSAAGLDRREELAYVAGFPNYIMWNALPGLLEYGYGDTPHVDNRLTRWPMYNHLSHIMHFYGKLRPDEAALAAYLRERFPLYFSSGALCVYPFLLTDLDIAPAPLNPGGLPAARFFPQMGQIFMRSGDGPTDTYCVLAGDGPTGQHRHYDAGHFIIYKQGHLALDTGTRQGNTDNLQNYFAQTIAHNTLLINMPGEKPSSYWNGTVYGQAGGQDKQVGSKVIAFETNPTYSYAAVDLTPVYNAEKCQQAVRQFIFVMPDHFVVFDRVLSTKPDYAKTWLLHFANEPAVDGQTARADQDKGRLFCRTLLPQDATIEKIGGPGKEFLVDGVNYPIDAGPAKEIVAREYTSIKRLEYKEVPELMGRWRLEIKPGAPRAEDVFLHVLQAADQTVQAMDDAQVRMVGSNAVLTFTVHEAQATVTLPTSGAIGGHIKIVRGGKVELEQNLTQTVMPQVGLAAVE
ncbi:MAG: heparinase II/III domain-containing protein [Armatimonadota bacterium]